MLRFGDIVFGPIHSRRLGSSLGVNLLPAGGKLCNFDCIYCECGWNRDGRDDRKLPGLDDVRNALEVRIKSCHEEGIAIDSITFSGNGEPTLHPDFPEIVDITIKLRDLYYPEAKVSVLSNATMLDREDILQSLKKVDNPILKLDALTEDDAAIINRPSGHYSVAEVIEGMKRFDGNFVLQTMFLRGAGADASGPVKLERWLNAVRELRPREIMVYTLDRETPEKGLEKLSVEEMGILVKPLRDEGFNVRISG